MTGSTLLPFTLIRPLPHPNNQFSMNGPLSMISGFYNAQVSPDRGKQGFVATNTIQNNSVPQDHFSEEQSTTTLSIHFTMSSVTAYHDLPVK